jgi:hypothetical protein
MKDKKLGVEITELFMAQASKDRKFYGTIKREDGVVRGEIKVNDGLIFAVARDQDTLGENLDDMVKLILDADLHGDEGKTSEVSGSTYFLN